MRFDLVVNALAFNGNQVKPALVLGVAAAGLYGLLAVTLVLTYRVSRTIGFVQGGIALMSTYLYYHLAGSSLSGKPRMGPVPALIIVLATGAALGVAYGMTVTGRRMANWPRITLTSYSLGCLLLLAGLAFTVIPADERRSPSPFGTGHLQVFHANVTFHQAGTLAILVALVGSLTFVLRRTRTGVHIRAIADDVEASRFVGIPLHTVGTGVYAFAGAVAALAGVLLASAVGTSAGNILFVFLRALVVAVLGGFTSMPLALAGCFVLGVGETMLTAGVFGVVPSDRREVILMGLIFGLVFVINRFRPVRVLEATGL